MTHRKHDLTQLTFQTESRHKYVLIAVWDQELSLVNLNTEFKNLLWWCLQNLEEDFSHVSAESHPHFFFFLLQVAPLSGSLNGDLLMSSGLTSPASISELPLPPKPLVRASLSVAPADYADRPEVLLRRGDELFHSDAEDGGAAPPAQHNQPAAQTAGGAAADPHQARRLQWQRERSQERQGFTSHRQHRWAVRLSMYSFTWSQSWHQGFF